MTKKVNPHEDYQLQNKIEKIINKNCEVIPWEGTEIDKEGILSGICELLSSKEYSLLQHTKNK